MRATSVLAEGAAIMAETTHTDPPGPDNADTIMYLQEQIMRRSFPPPVQSADVTMPANSEELDL